MMINVMDLKQIERKAFRSTYQDGLWDMYLGSVVVLMAIFMYRPESGYSAINIVMVVLMLTIAYSLFWAGKKYITVPRMGQVRFGPARQQKKKTLAIILGIFVLIQACIVGLTTIGLRNLEFGAELSGTFGSYSLEHIAVASLSSLFVGIPMLVIAFMNDFPRGYYIAIMMAIAVFMMILTNQPIYPIVIGVIIIVPGLVIFIRFLRKYPLPEGEKGNG
jgi:hypothetical protein